MQRTDLIREKKFAMENAFLREVGATPRAETSMRHWNHPWEISPKNRDRPGGHQTQYMSGWAGWKKSKYAKRKQNKKMRREHVRITAEAVREFYEDHELYLQEMAALYDEFWDDMIAYDYFWDDQLEAEQNMDLYDVSDSYEAYDPLWDLCYLD